MIPEIPNNDPIKTFFPARTPKKILELIMFIHNIVEKQIALNAEVM